MFGGLGDLLARAIDGAVSGAARLSKFIQDNRDEIAAFARDAGGAATALIQRAARAGGLVFDLVKAAQQSGLIAGGCTPSKRRRRSRRCDRLRPRQPHRGGHDPHRRRARQGIAACPRSASSRPADSTTRSVSAASRSPRRRSSPPRSPITGSSSP
jgi:hypothetical protein